MKLSSIPLALLLLITPFMTHPSYALTKKSMAVIEVYDQTPSRDLRNIRQQLEKNIQKSSRWQLASNNHIASYFNQTTPNKKEQTQGDLLYQEAEDLFLSFKLKQALEIVAMSLVKLKKKPGWQESLIKATLLKTQIEWELGKNKDAWNSILASVSYDLSRKQLDSYQYSPKLRRYYAKARAAYFAKNKTASLTITVNQSLKTPIYVNGVYRGMGPKKDILVPLNITQLVSAGSGLKKVVTKNKNTTAIIKGQSENIFSTPKKNIGFKNRDFLSLAKKAQQLGLAINASRVVLIKLNDLGSMSQLLVTTVNVKRGTVSKTLTYDVVDPYEDANTLSNIVSRKITALSTASFKKPHQSKISDPPKIKPKKKLKPHYLIAGLGIALGTGLITALAFSSSGKNSPNSEISISGPLPTAP
jgi:hypothetical protein